MQFTSPYGVNIVPINTKIIYCFTIAIINKCFEFQIIGLKLFVLGTIAGIFVLNHCVTEIKNFKQELNFWSDLYQNLISAKLH